MCVILVFDMTGVVGVFISAAGKLIVTCVCMHNYAYQTYADKATNKQANKHELRNAIYVHAMLLGNGCR